MFSILEQSRRRVERRRRWPSDWPGEVCGVAAWPAEFAAGFDELHRCDRAATTAALASLIGLVQSGDDLAASVVMCVFAPAIRKAARDFGVSVNEAAGELATSVGGFNVARNAAPTPGSLVADLRKRLVRRKAKDQRQRSLVGQVHHCGEEMLGVETRIDVEALVDQLGLGETDRALLAMVLADQSVRECATAFGVPEGTMYRRRESLQRQMRAGLASAA